MTTTTDERRCTCEMGAPCACGAYDERDNRVYLGVPPVAIPCPTWCGERPGHGYDMRDDLDHELRHHARWFGDPGEAAADVRVTATYFAGRELISDPALVVWIHGNSFAEEITDPGEVRMLGTRLLAAADLLESLQ